VWLPFPLAALAAAPLTAHASSPCGEVDRSLASEQKSTWTPEIAKRLAVSLVDVLQSFKVGMWRILYVDTHQSDEAFLFYSGDPLTSPQVTSWSGAAQVGEERQIKDWTFKNARGIPSACRLLRLVCDERSGFVS
jgi:hypothetical protein